MLQSEIWKKSLLWKKYNNLTLGTNKGRWYTVNMICKIKVLHRSPHQRWSTSNMNLGTISGSHDCLKASCLDWLTVIVSDNISHKWLWSGSQLTNGHQAIFFNSFTAYIIAHYNRDRQSLGVYIVKTICLLRWPLLGISISDIYLYPNLRTAYPILRIVQWQLIVRAFQGS